MHTQAKRSWRRLVRKLAIVDRLRAAKLKLVEAAERIERLKRNVQTADISTGAVVEHLNSLADSERQLKDELKEGGRGSRTSEATTLPGREPRRGERGAGEANLMHLTYDFSRSRCAARSDDTAGYDPAYNILLGREIRHDVRGLHCPQLRRQPARRRPARYPLNKAGACCPRRLFGVHVTFSFT